MGDFINDASDSELLAESQYFYGQISSAPASFGLTAAQATAFDGFYNGFNDAVEAHVAAQANAKSKTEAKSASRVALEQSLRELLRMVKATTSVSDSQFASLGQFASSSYTPLSNPTRPTGRVDTSQRMRHTIHFADEATPDQKRKPAGTVGCEIWAKVGGEAPSDEKECQFVTLDTATPYVYEFGGADSGKMIHYMLRWSLKDGTRSPWSETVSATVTG